ncbi:MAG: single-stranded DNA-binding protein [bacterium]
MQFSQNICFLIGNVTRDPELRFTPAGTAVAKFGLATSRNVKKDEKWEDITTFHNIVCWQKLAEHVAERLTKGTFVTIQGRIENRSYDGKDGVKRYISEVVADSVFFKSPKKEGTSAGKSGHIDESEFAKPDDEVPF